MQIEGGPYSPTENSRVRIALHERVQDSPLTAGAPQDDMVAHVQLFGPGRDGPELILLNEATEPLNDDVDCAGVAEVNIPEGAAGACTVRVSVSGLRLTEDGPPLFRATSADATLAVRAPVAVSFGFGRAWVHQRVPIIGMPEGPRPVDDEIVARLRVAGDDPMPVTLTWNATARRYEGDWIPQRAGAATVIPGPFGSAVIGLATGAVCEIRARAIRLLTPDGEPTPIHEIVLTRLEDGSLGARMRVAADLRTGSDRRVEDLVVARLAQGLHRDVAPEEGVLGAQHERRRTAAE